MRVGFLGTGWIASYHSKSLHRSGIDIERAGCYDIDRARAEAFAAASGHAVCGSEAEVLDGCDAVYITTWTSEHPRLVADAAARGLAIFCEKPLATNVADAETMLAAVTTAGVTNQVGLVLRHSPAYLWARHLIDDPTAGRVMTVVFRDDQFIPTQGHYASDWRADAARAGAGTLLEHSIHDIDMLTFLVASPISDVSARQANFHGHPGIEDVFNTTFGFANGASGTLTSLWHDNLARASLRRVEVFCERRLVVIDGDDWFGPVTWTDSDGANGSLAGDALVGATTAMLACDPNPDVAFITAALAGQPAFPDFAVAVEAHRVADAMYRSAKYDSQHVVVARARHTIEIVVLTAPQTHGVRQRVLRADTPSADPRYAQDDLPDTWHLGIRLEDRLVGVSTWAPEPWPASPGEPAVRLRGMAIDRDTQGTGAGAALLRAGIERARADGARLIWASARDSALGFYERAGFEAVGDMFIDEPTGMPHHYIVYIVLRS